MRSIVILATLLSIAGFTTKALAGKSSDCIEIAAAVANAGQREIEGWLTRYHRSYHNCILKKKSEIEKLVSPKKIKKKQVVKPSKTTRDPKKIIPQSAADTNSKMLKIPEIRKPIDPLLISWNTNCTQRYGSFSKDSEFYSASAGRRTPCATFRETGTLSLEKFLAE